MSYTFLPASFGEIALCAEVVSNKQTFIRVMDKIILFKMQNPEY